MAEYLPLTDQTAADRSRLEAQQRAAGLRQGDVTLLWHTWIVNPISGAEALVINGDGDKEYLTTDELSALLTESEAEAADWFLEFDGAD